MDSDDSVELSYGSFLADLLRRTAGKKCLRICYEKNKAEIRIGEKQTKIRVGSWSVFYFTLIYNGYLPTRGLIFINSRSIRAPVF